MHSKIFLHKYCVSAQEIEAVGEPGDSPLVYEGVEIDSGKKMRVEVFPVAALKIAVREKLETEAMAAKELDHPNIPALSDFGVEGDNLVYVTEDFDGTTAQEWVTTCGSMPVSPVLRIASQVVSALGKAAFHGIVHPAINPGNLVLAPGQTAQGEWPLVKVLHFVGPAPKFSRSDGSSAVLDKSLPYLSPEMLQNGTVDFRSEMYSLGATMWFLLTGAPPAMASQGSMATQSPTAALAAKKMSAMPKEIQRLVAQMLSASPAARPRDPLTFHRLLQDCLSQVERPAILSRKLASSDPQTDATALRNQLVPLKLIAIAALFLAMATLAALVWWGYAWPRQVAHAKGTVGVSKTVARAFPSPTPVSAKRTDPIVWIATPPNPAVAASNRAQAEPAQNKANARSPATGSVEYAPGEKVPVAPGLKIWEPPANLQTRNTTPGKTREASPAPPAIDSWKLAATTQVELSPVPAKLRDGKTNRVAQQADPKKTAPPEVRRAERAEPEVKRAAPTRPGERPTAVAPDTTVPLVQVTNSPAETTPREVKQTDSEPTILLEVPR